MRAQVLRPGSSKAKLSKAERKAALCMRRQQKEAQGQSAICLPSEVERQAQRTRTCNAEAMLSAPGSVRQPNVAAERIIQTEDELSCRDAHDLAGTRFVALDISRMLIYECKW